MSMFSQVRKTALYVLFSNSRIISIALVIIILGIGTFMFLIPKYQGIQNQGLLDFGNKQENLDNREIYLERLQGMVKEFNSINQKDVDNLKKLLPDSQEIPELFVMLDSLGRDIGLEVSRIAITPGQIISSDGGGSVDAGSEDEEKVSALDKITGGSNALAKDIYTPLSRIGTINIVLGVSSTSDDFSYAQFKTMLDTIEKNMRVLDLNSVSYSSGINSFVLNMTTYYLVS